MVGGCVDENARVQPAHVIHRLCHSWPCASTPPCFVTPLLSCLFAECNEEASSDLIDAHAPVSAWLVPPARRLGHDVFQDGSGRCALWVGSGRCGLQVGSARP
eukprot:scaffold183328_cov22-Tisochrysis_lutea.AAC.2